MDTRSIHITGSQATKLLRLAREGEVVTAVATDEVLVPLDESIHRLDDLHVEGLASLLGIKSDSPLNLLVPNANSRRWGSGLKTTVVSNALPPGSFLELCPGRKRKKRIELPSDLRVFIASPVLAILQGAQALERRVAKKSMDRLEATLRLMEFADECCGSYSRNPDEPRTGEIHYDGIKKSTRFIDADALRRAIKQVRQIDGAKLARTAVTYAIDGSGSPMESYLNHALTLPPRFGGLSMRDPMVNCQLSVDDSVWEKLKHSSLRPDLQWPDYQMLVEYLGDKEHAGKPARKDDKNRMQDYAIAQYAAFPLMYDDIKNATALNKTAMILAREFMRRGVKYEAYRVSRLQRDDGFAANQRLLVGALLPPVTLYE